MSSRSRLRGRTGYSPFHFAVGDRARQLSLQTSRPGSPLSSCPESRRSISGDGRGHGVDQCYARLLHQLQCVIDDSNAPPLTREQTLIDERSKFSDVDWRFPVTPRHTFGRANKSRLTALRCSMATPFGFPVDRRYRLRKPVVGFIPRVPGPQIALTFTANLRALMVKQRHRKGPSRQLFLSGWS